MPDPKDTGDRGTAADPPDPAADSPASAGGNGDAGAAGSDAGGQQPEPAPPADAAGSDDETIADFPAPAVVARDASAGGAGDGDDGENKTIEDFPPPPLTDYNPSKDREKIRGTIALILVWALVGVLVFSVVSSWFVMTTENRDALVRILEIVLTPLVALVGAVTGFYYGEKSK